MNNFVNVEYDSFEKKTEVRLKDFILPSIIDNTLDLQNITVVFIAVKTGENEPSVGLFIGHQEKDIPNSAILIKYDDSDILSYDTFLNQEIVSACNLTLAELRKICDAHKVEIRIKTDDGHTDFTSEDIQFGAQVLYNAMVDENAYMEEIQRREKEIAEKQQELERTKMAEMEKFNRWIGRIKNNGVNKFFSVDYDQFQQKLTVSIKDAIELTQIDGTLLILEPKIGFRFVYVQNERPYLLIDFKAVSKYGLNLNNGELLILLDQTKRLSLQPHESYSDPYLQEYHIESDWYEITADELKSLCEARVIEMRITNGDEYHDLTTDGLQLAARRFYNAVIDDTTYIDDLQTQEEREAAERERQQQEYYAEQERLRKEREAKEAEEARIRAEKRAEWWKKNGKKVWITIAIIAAIILAIIAVNKIQNAIAERQLNQKVEAAFLSGDSCINVFAFEDAEKFYEQAMELKNDGATRNRVAKKRTELSNVKQKADKDYDAAVRKLKILLDADDNEFNQYSNECLDKMIEIYPDRQETINYKNIRPTSLSAVPDYEKQGDELFAQAQYDKAEKKYKATEVVTELRGQAISAQLKEKKDKLSKCMDLIRKATASEDNQQYEEAEMFYSEIYAVHALPIYKQKATEYKRKLQVEQARNAKKNESQTFGKKIDYIDVIISSGGLSQIWSDDDAMTIKSLRIHGTMDARDFDYIRWHCMNIENIDLHDVTITAYTGAYGTNEGYNATYNANEIPLGAFFYWKNSYHHTTTKATSDRGMPSIKKVVLPNGITAIRRNAFARASNLEDINIPEGVTVIDWVAFSICSSIKKFILPSSLKNLGKAVFHATPALKELHLRGTTPPTFSSNTFDSSHYDNVTLFVPASALSTYKASEWKMFKNIVGE